jgi:hypothetical protein
MPFASAEEFRHFADSVKHGRRFIYEERVQQFLDALTETSVSRIVDIQKEAVFWRAQLGYQLRTFDKGEPEEEERPSPWFEDRMVPLPKFVGDGRANPRGVAYLYLASSATTAGSEVRPWLGATISMSQFKTNRALRLVDCTRDKKRWFKSFHVETGLAPWEPHEFESVVWGDIGYAMSTPYSIDEQSLNYVPTQIIAERLRHSGVDGMVYQSLLAKDGFNIVLFDPSDATPINFQLYEARSIAYTFEPTDNPFFAKRATEPVPVSPAERRGES